MFNFIDIKISFIPVSGGVGMTPQCTALPGSPPCCSVVVPSLGVSFNQPRANVSQVSVLFPPNMSTEVEQTTFNTGMWECSLLSK